MRTVQNDLTLKTCPHPDLTKTAKTRTRTITLSRPLTGNHARAVGFGSEGSEVNVGFKSRKIAETDRSHHKKWNKKAPFICHWCRGADGGSTCGKYFHSLAWLLNPRRQVLMRASFFRGEGFLDALFVPLFQHAVWKRLQSRAAPCLQRDQVRSGVSISAKWTLK